MLKDLPIYKATLSSVEDGIYTVSLVDDPAVESNFLMFSKNKLMFSIDDEEQRIITGCIMRCDFPIYRRDDSGYEYYIVFDKPTIELMAEKMLADATHNNINLEHNPDAYVQDVYLKELFFKDKSRGIVPKGFDDISDGSLFGTYKVLNDDVWSQIKEGTFKGFSIECYIDAVEVEMSKEDTELQLWSDILDMLKQIENKRYLR